MSLCISLKTETKSLSSSSWIFPHLQEESGDMHVNGNTGEISFYVGFFRLIQTFSFVSVTSNISSHMLLKASLPLVLREAVKQGGFIPETVLTRQMK